MKTASNRTERSLPACPRCEGPMVERGCKRRCPRCHYFEDCSDCMLP